MDENFTSLMQKIQAEFPDLITPDMLVKLGVASHVFQFRSRKRGVIPFLKLSNSRILYLKNDVISWLKRSYNTENSISESLLEECVSNESKA